MTDERLYLTGEIAENVRAGMWQFNLTERERRVAWHHIHGLSYQEIGQLLGIAGNTVKVHLAHIRRKCGWQEDEPTITAIRMLRLFAGADERRTA